MLAATTTRPVLCTAVDRAKRVVGFHRFPEGTAVLARELRDGSFEIRVPGAPGYTQIVYRPTLAPC